MGDPRSNTGPCCCILTLLSAWFVSGWPVAVPCVRGLLGLYAALSGLAAWQFASLSI